MIDLDQGYLITTFPLSPTIPHLVDNENWQALDQEFQLLCQKNGALFQYLKNFCDFNSIEFIISIRDGSNPDEEDGIWHDDGSRLMAFSLSLTKLEIQGGVLEIKHQSGNPHHHLPTPRFGEIIIFLTGVHDFHHKINRVIKGKRIIIAGWCAQKADQALE